MKRKTAYLNHMLGVAIVLLLAPAGSFGQEGYFGATQSIARGAEGSLPALAVRSDIFSGGGDGFYGAQQLSDTCVQSQQVTVGKTGHLMLVRASMGSASSTFADQDAGLSTCAVPRSNSNVAVPDGSAPQNQVEYGGGGM